MKFRGFKQKKNWTTDLPQTIISGVFLLFTILVSFGVISGQQVADAQPLITSTVGAISASVSGLIALYGIFFKKNDPVE